MWIMMIETSFKYKRTTKRRMQLWPHRLDWWWNQRNSVIRKIAVTPVIEVEIVTERKFVERLRFLDISNLITNK